MMSEVRKTDVHGAAGDRRSVAGDVVVPTDPDELARIDARNALRQVDEAVRQIEQAIDGSQPFRLRPSAILLLNRRAIEGIEVLAGNFRTGPITINGSQYVPPPAEDVPRFVEDLCDYINENWAGKSPLHLAAYCMWRLNWIHPFVDGNGRTARAVSHVVFCARIGFLLPGVRTIPEQIAANKKPYYDALEAADLALARGTIDLTAMEKLMEALLAVQLTDIHRRAVTGR